MAAANAAGAGIDWRRWRRSCTRASRSSTRAIPPGGRSSTSTSRGSSRPRSSACWSRSATGTIGDETDKGLVAIIALVGVALTILVGFVKRVATSYTITNRRLNIKRGIVSRTIQETRLERVQNVNYRQSVLQRMLQIGDVDFDTAAGDDYNFIFEGVGEPADVVHMVDQATGVASPEGLGDQTARPASSEPAPPAG